MQLNYRGVQYEYNPPSVEISTTNSPELDWRFRNQKKLVGLQPSVTLTWRGIKYNNSPTEEGQIQEKSRWLMLRRQQKQLNRKASRQMRLANEIGLMEA